MPAAPKTKTAAARAERAPQPRSLDWNGLELELPANLPGELVFDLAAVETNRGPASMLGAIRTVIGDEQLEAVRERIVELGLTLDDVGEALGELVTGIWAEYGLTPGESDASPQS